MRNCLAIFSDNRSSLFIKQSPNLRTRAFTLLSNSNDLFHRFPRSIDHSFSFSDYRKLILSTIHVSDTRIRKKRFPIFRACSKYQAANVQGGQEILQDNLVEEMTPVHWERGIVVHCVLIQRL